MGWSIKTNNKSYWNVFYSVTDCNIATFRTKEGLIRFLATDRIYSGKLKAIEILMTFPNDWYINDERMREIEKLTEYYDWYNSICVLGTNKEYFKAIDDKLQELME